MEKFSGRTTDSNMHRMTDVVVGWGSLQNVRVKALRPAIIRDVSSWMEGSHLGLKMSNIMYVFMMCACACMHQQFHLCQY